MYGKQHEDMSGDTSGMIRMQKEERKTALVFNWKQSIRSICLHSAMNWFCPRHNQSISPYTRAVPVTIFPERSHNLEIAFLSTFLCLANASRYSSFTYFPLRLYIIFISISFTFFPLPSSYGHIT